MPTGGVIINRWFGVKRTAGARAAAMAVARVTAVAATWLAIRPRTVVAPLVGTTVAGMSAGVRVPFAGCSSVAIAGIMATVAGALTARPARFA